MRWAWVLAVMLVACGLPGGASSHAGDVITPSQARQVIERYWTQNEKANMASDPALFEPIEAGPALIFDQAQAVRYAKENRHLAQARPLRKVTVYVAHQSRYPAEFAARIDTVGTDQNGKLTTQPFSFFNLFEKASAGQDWKSTFFVDPEPGETITIAIGNDGYVSQVPVVGGAQVVAPGRLGQVVADYLNAATAGMAVDNSKLDGSSVIDGVARGQRLSVEGAGRAGFTLTYAAAPGPGGAHAYRSAQGRAVVFFAVAEQQVVAIGRSGACIVQDQRMRLPPEVPPGNYGRLENKVLALLIASDPPAGQGKATVLGVTSLDYDYRAEPAAGSCTQAGPPSATV
jgi:hypothetical protein